MDKQLKNNHLIIRIDDELKKQYKKYCDDNGYTLSKRIIALIKKELELCQRL